MTTAPRPSPFLNSSFSGCFIKLIPATTRDTTPVLSQAVAGALPLQTLGLETRPSFPGPLVTLYS